MRLKKIFDLANCILINIKKMKLKTEKVMKNNLKKSFNPIPWDNLRKNSLGINQGFKKRWGSQYDSTENSFPFKSSSISSATYFPAPADRINLKKYFQFSLDISRVNSENYSFLIIIRVDSGIFLCDSYLQIDNSRKNEIFTGNFQAENQEFENTRNSAQI